MYKGEGDEEFSVTLKYEQSGPPGEQDIDGPLTITVWVWESPSDFDATLTGLTFTTWTTTEKLATEDPSDAFAVE